MLDSFKEIYTSTLSTAAQRVKNPALGAFVLSLCSFNWKSILYLLFSETGILDKINYISGESTWKSVIGYPAVSVIVICGFLPWVNNLISQWQIKPLDNTDSIQNLRKAKEIRRATRLRRLQAKQDVTYEKVKTGAEKDIQKMKEDITESQVRMGELSAERDKLKHVVSELEKQSVNTSKIINTLESEKQHLEALVEEQKARAHKAEGMNAELIARMNDMASSQIPGPRRSR